jgi:methylphosphotriester-DNA--protein-cysteine methyltransferase
MSPDLEKKILEKYPDLYYHDNDSSLMGYGFAHGDGWFNIIDCLSSTITHIVKNDKSRKHLTPEEFAETRQVRVAQVKEKFGSLRFYVDNGNPEVYAAIQFAEAMSYRTCETCGAPGRARVGGWVRTLCDACDKGKNGNG